MVNEKYLALIEKFPLIPIGEKDMVWTNSWKYNDESPKLSNQFYARPSQSDLREWRRWAIELETDLEYYKMRLQRAECRYNEVIEKTEDIERQGYTIRQCLEKYLHLCADGSTLRGLKELVRLAKIGFLVESIKSEESCEESCEFADMVCQILYALGNR